MTAETEHPCATITGSARQDETMKDVELKLEDPYSCAVCGDNTKKDYLRAHDEAGNRFLVCETCSEDQFGEEQVDAPRYRLRTVKFLDALDAAIIAGTIVDFMMPNGKRFGDCTHHELRKFGVHRDTVERTFDADVTKGLYRFEGEWSFGVKGTSQIYTVKRHELDAVLETDGEA
jgi:hypothetical protein